MHPQHPNILSAFLRDIDWSKILDFRNFTQDEQKQLFSIYTLLLAGVLVTGVGSWFGIHAASFLSVGIVEVIGLLVSIACLIYIQYKHATEISHHGKGASMEQLAAFGGFSFSTGMSLIGLILHTMFIDHRLLVTAIIGSAAIFASLSLSALLSARRSYFFLASILGTMTTYMMFASIAGLFIPSQLLFNVVTWGGLIMGIGYTLVDTQLIAESIRRGNRNAVVHCLTLYLDAIRVFVYLLALIMKRQDREDRRKRS